MSTRTVRVSRKVSLLILLVGLLGLSGCTAGSYPLLRGVAEGIVRLYLTTVGSPLMVPDGNGGVYVAYQKNLQGLGAITYLQRLDPSGKPSWPGAGTKIYLDKFPGMEHVRVPLGELVPAEDGAILVWYSGSELRAQKVDLSGNLLWGREGLRVSRSPAPVGPGARWVLSATSDGADGVVIASYANPSAGISLDRLDAAGKSLWSGRQWLRPPSFPPSTLEGLDLARDADGNVFVVWCEHIFWGLQKVNADGELEWGPDGIIPIQTMSGLSCKQVVGDGAGGAIVLCGSQGSGQSMLVGQHFDAQGKLLWPEGGLPLGWSSVGRSQTYGLAPDGAGGALVAWQSPDREIYVQRWNAEGQPSWGAQGMKLAFQTSFLSLAPGENPGEALIAWPQYVSFLGRQGAYRLRAQKLSAEGAPAWETGGAAFTALEPVSADTPLIVADGNGGAWVAWTAGPSSGGRFNDATYVQRIAPDGQPLWGAAGIKLSALR